MRTQVVWPLRFPPCSLTCLFPSLRGVPRVLPPRFTPTRHSLQLMERLAVCVRASEPVLLVGETGNGKTSVVQALAYACGQTLKVQNLNVQSDSGDLFGGFRPVQLRQLGYELLHAVLELFPMLSSVSSNQAFFNQLHKAYKEERWKSLSKGVHQALGFMAPLVQQAVTPDAEGGVDGGQPSQKRGAATGVQARYEALTEKSKQFALQTADASHPFAFAFVEGMLIQAARKGEWVLLDEVNLAPPDTLQRLSGLLDAAALGDGGLCLTERGDVETLSIHPNFRLFAAMNPPTDVGKKDLPGALRTRFTEVRVACCCCWLALLSTEIVA